MLIPNHIQHHDMLLKGSFFTQFKAILPSKMPVQSPVLQFCAYQVLLISTGYCAISELLDLLAQLSENSHAKKEKKKKVNT